MNFEELIGKLPAGNVAEIGTARGAVFRRLAGAVAPGFKAYAFDSFRGMAEPGPKDTEQYPRGKFDVGGVARFQRIQEDHGLDPERFVCFPGFVPKCFEPANHISFVYIRIDLDHYEPTKIAADWALKHLVAGGVLSFHDWYFNRDVLAGLAIREWLGQWDLTQSPFERAEIDLGSHELILYRKK